MAKYLLLKRYRGAPAPVNDVPMDQWKPEEVEAHIRFMNDFAARLESSGEFIDGQALSPDGVWVRYDGGGKQGGDPAKLATALVQLAGHDEPPLRWVAGADAVEAVEKKARILLSQVDAHRELSSNLAHDDV